MPTKKNPPASAVPQRAISSQLQRRLDRHFVACSATVGALAVAAGGAHEVKGAIVYSGIKNIAIPSSNFAGIYFDFDTNTTSTSNIANVSDANLFDAYGVTNGNTYFYHSLTFFGPNKSTNGTVATLSSNSGETMRLGLGVTLGSSPVSGVFGRESDLAVQFYNYHNGAPSGPLTGQWATGGIGYIGFRFVSASGQTDYGWMRVSFDQNKFLNQQVAATVIDWAYNNTGDPITIGQIPEPSSVALGLLGAGAAGLAIWRQRRRQSQAAQATE